MKVCAIMMQKDEGHMLRAWADFYSNLFGIENLYIFDNVSTDLNTIMILKELRESGANIFWNIKHYENKGQLVTNLIKSMQGKYDAYLPVDCDEFLCLEEGQQIVSGKENVLKEIERHVGQKKVLRIATQYFNLPRTKFGYKKIAKKTMILDGIDVNIGIGFHLYNFKTNRNTIPDESFLSSKLAYVHLHNKPFPLLLTAARNKLAAHISDFSRSTLSNYDGTGRHLTRYFLISEMDYMEMHPKAEVDLQAAFFPYGMSMPYSD